MAFNELRMGYGPHLGLLFEAWSDAELGDLWVGMEYIIDSFFLSQILFLIALDNLYGSTMPLFFNIKNFKKNSTICFQPFDLSLTKNNYQVVSIDHVCYCILE